MEKEVPANERAVWILKTRGPQPLSAIAKEMDVTKEGARFHLLKLEKEGLVESRSEAKGRGRPKKIWSLTDKGNARFPDMHGELAVNLIAMMRESLGEEALQKVVEANENRTLKQYTRELEECNSLEDKVARLTEIRSREGYMAEYEKDDEGYLFVENHCPICSAAQTCQGFCRAELNIFQEVLGDDVNVEREEHIIKGARRCAYRITKD
ncbi:transcriptional regulator [Aliifodinibius sp. S!AR15-10]|uniref:helix-turn-helix transcriptional regulator n=1 Tax=Aliifodinibius sp. S!AR15-10 TaxID=2950437 RepID=UPI002861BF4E|nr:metalloregulator ArsR/SmtB family transcription factor [Aliifodinibius sp. S!AR15-10]MDR8393758.1 transcriptional regulator [Aliifodinibius sp. S!AR15-10]